MTAQASRRVRRLSAFLAPFLALAVLTGTPAQARAAPEIVASIPPLHSLAAGVMAGVGTPRLLIEGAASPHSYVLKPSDARALARARLVVWAGPAVESFLARSLAALAPDAAVIEMLALPGIRFPAPREDEDDHDKDDHDHDSGHDPHAWLDPVNARVLVAAMAKALAHVDPANAALYRRNAAALDARLRALDSELARRLAPIAGRPFVVFHDAYRHLEARYGLGPVIPVTAAPSRPLSPRHLVRIRDSIREKGVRCLFAEPQFSERTLTAISEDTGTGIARLDPVGAELTPGPDLYGRLMRANAAALVGCLGR